MPKHRTRLKPGRRLLYIDPERFGTLRRAFGLTQPACATLLKVSLRTVQNWENGKSRIPWCAFKVLQLTFGDEIPHPAWTGWYLRRGLLWSPESRPFEPGQLRTLHYVFQANRHLRKEVAELQEQLNPRNVALPDFRPQLRLVK